MQKQLLVYALIIALLSSYTLSGQEKNQLTIITDNVECVVGHQYKMLMTNYSDKVYDSRITLVSSWTTSLQIGQ